MKLHKFVKDPKEMASTLQVLKKFYPQLKNQFNSQIGSPKTYPFIGLVDFANFCEEWDILGDDLTRQQVDQAFIATNFEEVDLDNNDDKKACRYEFLEMIVRLAKVKFVDTGKVDTINDATYQLLSEFIIPNTTDVMPWQEFREDELWCLDVDDLFKANSSSIDQLYKWCKT